MIDTISFHCTDSATTTATTTTATTTAATTTATTAADNDSDINKVSEYLLGFCFTRRQKKNNQPSNGGGPGSWGPLL